MRRDTALVLATCAALAACGGPASPTVPDPTPAPLPAPAPLAVPPIGPTGGATAPAAAGAPLAATARVLATGRRAGDVADVVAVAVAVAAQHLDAPGRGHLVVEAVDRPGHGAAVVVVASIRPGVAAEPPTVRRLAVPVAVTEGRVVPGPVWELPAHAPTPAAEPLVALPVTDPGLARLAVTAIDAAGWDEVVLEELALAVDAWPHVATFTAAAPDGGRRRHRVWLRRHLDRLVVAGLPAPAPTSRPRPAGDPPRSEEPR